MDVLKTVVLCVEGGVREGTEIPVGLWSCAGHLEEFTRQISVGEGQLIERRRRSIGRALWKEDVDVVLADMPHVGIEGLGEGE